MIIGFESAETAVYAEMAEAGFDTLTILIHIATTAGFTPVALEPAQESLEEPEEPCGA